MSKVEKSTEQQRRLRSLLLGKLRKYITSYLDTRIIFAIDLVISVVSSFIILLVLSFFATSEYYQGAFSIWWSCGALVSSLIALMVCQNCKVVIRHSQCKDLLKIFYVALVKEVCLGLIIGISCIFNLSAFIALASDFVLTASLLIFIRLMMIMVYSMYKSQLNVSKTQKRVLVYGTSDKSMAVLTRLASSTHYEVVGFLIPEALHEKKLKVAGLPVFGYDDFTKLGSIISRLSLDYILFANEKDAKSENERLIKYCSEHNVKILIAPSINEVVGGRFMKNKVREIKIEDLLGRDEIVLSPDEFSKDIHNKTVLVTGAAGSIGSELCRQLATMGVRKLILYDNAETPMHNIRLEIEERYPKQDFVPVIGDVRQEARLDFVFRDHHPDIVFHAAAYKHVPLMEENPCEAVLVNVIGSRNVANKCIEYGTEKMVMISTDKAVNPTNIMGCSKRLAEIYVQSLGLAIEKGEVHGRTKFVTTRFGNVLGSNGSVIPRFREQIEKGGPVTVTDPRITRFFMTIPEACRLVMEASQMSTGNQIFVFDMGESVKIDDLAKRMISLAGLKAGKDIEIEYTGLRPGEKLYEEVLSSAENTDPTEHSRIRIARVRQYAYKDAVEVVDQLEMFSRAVLIPDMVILMKKTVPEFISQNSKYEIFDKK